MVPKKKKIGSIEGEKVLEAESKTTSIGSASISMSPCYVSTYRIVVFMSLDPKDQRCDSSL